ncbi:M23 family metallopeptidase [Ornithinimicrobium murale]|uniref:M23 family metallopeptidase n=1 Tax=Ornithinimicrobium murale TaxID=1050153 RepID=UPI003B513174
MKKALIVLLAAAVMFGPAVAFLGVGVLLNPAARADATVCAPGDAHLHVDEIPDSLTATTRNGETIVLTRTQLEHAATIITVGAETEDITDRGVIIALMAALTESHLRMLSNSSAYPESIIYPNDGDGSDHDSLGLFQMRPSMGWGSVSELMRAEYQAQAFYGGPDGPNSPSPRGLLDIPGWQDMDPGEAAQAVEVSAYPDRYRNYQPVAETILTTLTRTANTGTGSSDTTVPETSRVAFPLPEGTWVKTSDWGWRTDPFTGEQSFHAGTDWAAPDGTALFALADGRVLSASYTEARGGVMVLEHNVRGQAVTSTYVHMWSHGIHVTDGQEVRAGQHIGDVGSSGRSTGPHLHLEIRPGGQDAETVDAEQWLLDQDAEGITGGDTTIPPEPGCTSGPGQAGAPEPFDGDNPDAMVDDPTSDGQITARTAHILDQVQTAFPDSSWVCYSPRPGQASDHPLGRACDGTFGNAIGEAATGQALELGWAVTNWLQEHAETLGIDYLIWQGQIWSAGRADEGWRDYDGGGMHDPGNVTGGHYDHTHLSAVEGR